MNIRESVIVPFINYECEQNNFDLLFEKACKAKDYITLLNLVGKYLSKISQDKINDIFFDAMDSNEIDLVRFFLENKIVDSNMKNLDNCPILFRSCRLGRLELVQLLIRYGADLHTDSDDTLVNAIQSGSTNLVRFLLENGVKISDNAISHACIHQNPQSLKLLLKHGATLDVPRSKDGDSLLHLLCCYPFWRKNESPHNPQSPTIGQDSRKQLLDILKDANKIDFFEENSQGLTPLSLAIQSGYKDVLEYCFEHLRKNTIELQSLTPDAKFTLWKSALKSNNSEILDIFYKYKLDFSGLSDNKQATVWRKLLKSDLVKESDIESVLDLGLNIQCKDKFSKKTPLHFACKLNKGDAIRVLLQRGALKNVKDDCDRTPFDRALEYVTEQDIIDEFLKDSEFASTFELRGKISSANFEKLFHSPIFFNCPMKFIDCLLKFEKWDELFPEAIKKYPEFAKDGAFCKFYMKLIVNGNLKIIQELYEKGIEIPQGDEQAKGPLHYACVYSQLELVKWFLDKKIDCNARDSEDRTPLHIIFDNNIVNEEILDLFINNGFDIYAQDEDGNTIFAQAILNDLELPFLKKLLSIDKNKRFLSIPTKEGNLPIHLLSICGNFEFLEHLFDNYEIEVNQRNNKGQTPIHLAASVHPGGKEERYLKTMELLIQRGANLDLEDMLKKNIFHLLFSGKPSDSAIRNLFLDKCSHLLLEKDCKGITPLHVVCKKHSKDVIAEIFELCEKKHTVTDFSRIIDDSGKTLLHFAAINKDTSVLEFLLEKGLDVHARTQDGVQPIHIALRRKRNDNVNFLLEQGASPKALTHNGTSCLDLTLMTKQNDIALELIEKGAVLFSGKKSRSMPSEFWQEQIPKKIQERFLQKALEAFQHDKSFTHLSFDKIKEQPELLLQSAISQEALLEFLYLAQNQSLVVQIIPQINVDAFYEGIEKFSLDVPNEELLEYFTFEEVDPEHFAIEVTPKNLPQWEDASVQITDLDAIISDLDFTDTDSENYIAPHLLISNTKSYEVKDLQGYFKTYVKRIVNEEEFTGTPKRGTEQIKDFYNRLKNAVLPLISKMKTLGTTQEEKELKMKILLEILPGISHCGPRWQLDALRAYVKFILGKKDDFEFQVLQLLQEKRGLIVDSLVDPSDANNIHDSIAITKILGDELGLVRIDFDDEFASESINKRQILHRFFKAYTTDDIVDLIWIEVNNARALNDLLIEKLFTMDCFPIPEGVDDEIDYLMNLWTEESEKSVSDIIFSKKRVVRRETIVQVLKHLKIIREIKPKT